jgi:hypothetical protein
MKHLTPYKLFENRSLVGERLLALTVHMFDNENGINEIAELLRLYPEVINYTDAEGNTPLILSAAFGKFNMTYFLIENGADLTIRNMNGKNFIDRLPIKDVDGTKSKIRDWFEQQFVQRPILTKDPSLYNSFVKNGIAIHPNIEREFGFAKAAGDLNLL